MTATSTVVHSPLISVEDAAEALSTTVAVMRYLFNTRRLGHIRRGRTYVMLADDLAQALTHRDELLEGLDDGRLADERITIFEGDDLTSVQIARFFKVAVSEVRHLLCIKEDESIAKSRVWTLIAMGSEEGMVGILKEELRINELRRRRRRPNIPQTIRNLIRQRDHDRCRYCGTLMLETDMHLDHVIPRVQGGSDDVDNLVVACSPCNASKGNRQPHEAGMRLLPIGSTGPRRTQRVTPSIPYPYTVTGRQYRHKGKPPRYRPYLKGRNV